MNWRITKKKKIGNIIVVTTAIVLVSALFTIGPSITCSTFFDYDAIGEVHSDAWERINPVLQGNPLNGVWGSSSSNVYAVGHNGIMHYDGSDWTLMDSTLILTDIWGSSASDIYAMGYGGTILHLSE